MKDVSYIAILDENKNVLFSQNFDSVDENALFSVLSKDVDPVSIHKDRTMFVRIKSGLFLVLLAYPESNDVFMHDAFSNFEEALDKIVKDWCSERIGEKYDQIVLTFNEFVFNGIVLTDKKEELEKRVVKRTFENISGIKMNKGFASFLNKATKSMRH